MKTKSNSKKRKQRQYQAAEKVAILREHLVEKVAVSDVCEKYGLAPSVYYRWQKQFFEGGEKAFAPAREGQQVQQLKQEVAYLEGKLRRKDEVIGDLTEEYVAVKKRNGNR